MPGSNSNDAMASATLKIVETSDGGHRRIDVKAERDVAVEAGVEIVVAQIAMRLFLQFLQGVSA